MRPRLLVAVVVAGILATTTGVLLRLEHGVVPDAIAPLTVPGDFDSDPASQGWLLDAGAGTVALDDGLSRAGSSSLLVQGARKGSGTFASYPHLAATGGKTYAASAFSLVTSGQQELRLTFHDAAGRMLGKAMSSTGSATGVWSRVAATAAAPPNTSSVALTLSARPGTESRVHWDDVSVVDLTLPDGGLESASSGTACPLGWTCDAAANTSATLTAVESRTGSGALLLSDRSHEGSAAAISPIVQVQPSVGHTFEAWFLAKSGQPAPTLRVRWYDAARSLLATKDPVTPGPGQHGWRRLDVTLAAPDTAAWAAVELATSEAGTGEVVCDDVSVVLANSAPTRHWDSEPVASLDGFTTTTTSRVVDVRDRPKLITVVSGAPATLQVADLQTGSVEDNRPLPGLVHGWALSASTDGRSIYIGAGAGHLARYDLASQSLTDLGRATPSATLIFDLATGSDGRVWGASYPGGQVWVYDPAGRDFTRIEPVGDGHEYARSIAVDADWIYVGTGANQPGIVRISVSDPRRREVISLPQPVDTGFVVSLDLHGRYLAARLPEGRRAVYDTESHSWDVPLARDANGQAIQQTPTTTSVNGAPFYYLSNGRLWKVDPRVTGAAAKHPVAIMPMGTGRDRTVTRTRIGGVLGDWIIAFDGLDTVTAVDATSIPASAGATLPSARVQTFTIRLRANPVPIKSLAIGSRGSVLVGGFGGSSLSILDPSAARPRLTPLISDPVGRNAFGEVEGMVSNGRFDFFGSYTSARIFRRDSTLPWIDGENPRLLASLGPSLGQDRPIAWAATGDRTVFGTIPRYGRLGGVLGWFDGAATTPRTVWSPVPEQSVVALSATGPIAYGGTSRWGGLGVKPATSSAEVFAYDLESERTLWHVAPIDGAQAFAAVLVDAGNRLWAATQTTLFELEPRTGVTLRRIPVIGGAEADGPSYRTVDLARVDGTIVMASHGGLYAVDVATLAVTTIASRDVSPPRVRALDGVLYYPSRATLMRATGR